MKALGVDVGLRKGLDLVLLDDQLRIVASARRLAHDAFRAVVLDWRPDVVAIDSPPCWAAPGNIRATERALLRRGIQLYVTPEEAKRSQAGFHDWMLAGMEAFTAIADHYPLFTGGSAQGHALEVFPHGAAVTLAGGLAPPAVRKARWRRTVLETHGIDTALLRSSDLVDAALAAVTGIAALQGTSCWFGDPAEGVIVLPCPPDRLPSRFLRLDG